MSGHSKWATIKHKKGAIDKARGKLFAKLARQLEVAARSGGMDVDTNASLRTMVQKAKAGQMTKDAIDRAIKRGGGETGGANYESIMYEGYAPGGVALLVDVLTDNRNRTASDVRNAFTKFGGSLAEPGAVSWQFARRGRTYHRNSKSKCFREPSKQFCRHVVVDGPRLVQHHVANFSKARKWPGGHVPSGSHLAL
jgi:YebC/PmpR family DNA-binding regulatory protein